MDDHDEHHRFACKMITVWTQEIAAAHNLDDFQASRGWLLNFMRRSKLSVRRRTTTGQTMLKETESCLASSVGF